MTGVASNRQLFCCCRPYDARGKPVYHTNVVMCVGTDVAVVCGESVRDEAERRHLMVRGACCAAQGCNVLRFGEVQHLLLCCAALCCAAGGGAVRCSMCSSSAAASCARASLASPCAAAPLRRCCVQASLRRHHAVVDISCAQMDALAGNMLEVQTGTGLPLLVMSQQAKDSLQPDQLALIKRHVADIIHPDISTLEAIGGGGVRCCIAELF